MVLTAKQLFDASQHFNFDDKLELCENEHGIFVSNERITLRLNDKKKVDKTYRNCWEESPSNAKHK